MDTLILIIAVAFFILLRFEQERQRKAKHRAATATLLDRIKNSDLPATFRPMANTVSSRLAG